MNKITLKKKSFGLGRFKKSFIALCSVSALALSSTAVNAQCDPGYSSVNVRIENAGDYVDENYVTISTQINGGGVILWAQNGTGVIDTDICLLPGVYYINAYDTYGDGWNGNILHLSSYGSSYAGFPVIDPDNDYIEGWGGVLDLEGSYMFTVGAPPSCIPPTNLTTSNATLSSIDVSWTGIDGQTGDYELVWGPSGFDVDAVTPITLTSSTYTINTTGGDYEYSVRQSCGPTDVSNWSTKKAFRISLLGEDCSTPILVSSLPYTTTDDTANYGDNPTIEGTPGTSCGATNSYLSGNDVVYKYIADFTGVVRVALSGLTATYSGVFAYNSCADIGVSCAGGIGSATSDDKFFDLAVTEGEDYFIVISTWANPQTVGYTLTISELACPAPTNVTTGVPTLTSTEISWNGVADGSYEINWGVGTFAAGEGSNNQTTTGLSFTIEGLSSSTNYRYFVRRLCGEEGQSDWVGPYTFVTDNAPLPTPWYEPLASSGNNIGWNTSGYTVGNSTSILPNGSGYYVYKNVWSESTTNYSFTSRSVGPILTGDELTFNYSTREYSPGDGATGNFTVAISSDNGVTYTTIHTVEHTEASIPWTEVGPIDLSAYVGQNIKLKFTTNYTNGSDYYIGFDDFRIDGPECETEAPFGDTIQALAQGQTLADLVVEGENLKWYSDEELTNEIPSSTQPTTGTTYYVTQTIDDCESEIALGITVDVSLSNNSLDIVDLRVYPNPTSEVLNIDYKEVITNVTIFDIKGRQVGAYKLNDTTNSISVDALSSGTYLLKIETETNETSIVKFIKK